jgi:hypothetical protein
MMKIDWSNLPLRKPLATYSALLIGVAVLASIIFRYDLTEGVVELLKWLGVTTIGGYFATSTIEATSKKGGD